MVRVERKLLTYNWRVPSSVFSPYGMRWPIRLFLPRRVVDLYILEWVEAKVQVRGMSEGLKTLRLSFVRLEW